MALIHPVTPLAGVWIEISPYLQKSSTDQVTPLAGVWIEMSSVFSCPDVSIVTPLAGVWIEIPITYAITVAPAMSLPLRECGLKYTAPAGLLAGRCHSPCGSVD